MKKMFVMMVLVALSSSACSIQSAATVRVRPEVRGECVETCQILGMRMGAVVVMMNHAGCVCEPMSTPGQPVAAEGGATLAGGATIMAAHLAQQQQQQNQSSQRR